MRENSFLRKSEGMIHGNRWADAIEVDLKKKGGRLHSSGCA
jgi:hypothetical protein